MARVEGVCKEVIEKSEWVAIATIGPDGPHVVATWSEYIRTLWSEGDTLLIPVGSMHKTEANLQRDSRVELLCGTRQVQGARGPGKGCAIVGRAELQTDGPHFATVKAKFPWARAALVVRAEKVEPQL